MGIHAQVRIQPGGSLFVALVCVALVVGVMAPRLHSGSQDPASPIARGTVRRALFTATVPQTFATIDRGTRDIAATYRLGEGSYSVGFLAEIYPALKTLPTAGRSELVDPESVLSWHPDAVLAWLPQATVLRQFAVPNVI
ncbi:MAG TPA: hypothetical protein VGC34_04960, partial [Steroidobacteraceae bacterium]